jgi:AcrR family transcriptional regulator
MRRPPARRLRATSQRKRGRPADPSLPGRRREEILAVAARMFARHGYTDLDIGALGRRVGLGKATIYRYFPSKRQLFRQTVLREMEQLRQASVSSAEGVADDLSYIRQRMVAFLHQVARNPHVVKLLIIDQAEALRRGDMPAYFIYRKRQLPTWVTLLARLRHERRIRDVDFEMVAACFAVIGYGAIVSHPFLKSRRLLTVHATGLVDILLNGIRARRSSR